jgi:anti-sigma-K factor RskA
MSHDETFDTLVAVYAVGALDGEERARFEGHLAEGCVTCERALRESSEAFAALAAEGPRAIPPAHVKHALMRRMTEEAPAARRPRPASSRLRWFAAAAAAVIIVSLFTGAYVAVRYEARLGQMARETAGIRERLRLDQQALHDELATYRDVVELLRDPATRVVTLSGLGPAPQALARVVWNDRTGGHIFIANLAPAPPGKDYELWTIGAGAPRPAGLVAVQASGKGSQRLQPAPGGDTVKVFAVTLEPSGGTTAPTGPMILASK